MKMKKHSFLVCSLLLVLKQHAIAGPVKRSLRMVREVYPEIEPENDGNQAQVCIVGDVVYGLDEAVPAEQPCLKCKCQSPGVQCETIRCVKKPGCKAVHRPNKCCPDYQCECEHEGRIYANGERLKSPPGGECKVCYCRGGEVQCAEVSCYIRTDCEAKTVPGQCCPKYDHCPPKERSNHTITKEILELWPISEILNSTDDSNKILDSSIDRETTTESVSTTESIKQVEQPKITIQEIIPEIKEIAITEPARIEPVKELIIEEKINDLTDSEPESSELTEVFQQPPAVLRIGDKLLFLKQGEFVPEKDASTPTSVITLIGAEGLQRGFEESAESPLNDVELNASESTHILSLLKPKPEAENTTAPDTTKILPEVLEIRNNKTVPHNTSNSEWLKNGGSLINLNATLPEEILNEDPESDLEENSQTTTETTENVTETTFSVEESFTEETTPKSMKLNETTENASLESFTENYEALDMLANDTLAEEVEVFNATTEKPELTTNLKDVETFKPEKLKTHVLKRENSQTDENDAIFQQLNAELNAENTERSVTEEDEKAEADAIFRELLQETSTPKAPVPKTREEEALQRVTDALAKLTLRGGKNALNSNILGILSDFFSSQYRYYDGKD